MQRSSERFAEDTMKKLTKYPKKHKSSRTSRTVIDQIRRANKERGIKNPPDRHNSVNSGKDK